MKIPPPPPAPVDWPKQADEDYDRIRVLGAGAFGEVWLARSKLPDENGKHVDVAIKGVGIGNENEGATAAREMAILSELNHPNIIKILQDYEPASASAKGRYMALQFVNGPDIGQLLEERGALGLPLAQLIAQHLISAVAYCHVRGVMHRDIKPDNIMLEGCTDGKKWINDDTMWEDDEIKAGRFKAVLVDFGFAGATSAEDYEEEEVQDPAMGLGEKRKSRVIFRAKSAIGTKHFAPPELLSSVRSRRDSETALTPCVSSYSLSTDAYAIGATLSEMTTGVPPGQDIDAYVKENRKKPPKLKRKSSLLSKSMRTFSRRISSGSSHKTYDIQLRNMSDLPSPVVDIIDQLMIPNTDLRMTVREAQDHEWIGGYDTLPHGDIPSSEDSPMVLIENKSALM
ncbi:hypothetical protein ACHAWF_006427 [Thalassiosira exigua]